MKALLNVNLYGLHPMMQIANCVMAVIFFKFGVDEPTITSAVDGIHSENSLHKRGRACDYRIWGLSEVQLNELVIQARKSLGNSYDVVLESTHLHIEYDPKNPKVI